MRVTEISVEKREHLFKLSTKNLSYISPIATKVASLRTKIDDCFVVEKVTM